MIKSKYKIDRDLEPLSRYKDCYRLVMEDGSTRIETVDPVEIEISDKDTFYKVSAGEENRLDLVSFKFYNTPLLYWVIAKASNITNPLNVPIGTLLRIPSKSTIYGLKGVGR